MLHIDTQIPENVHFFRVPFTEARQIYGRSFGFEMHRDGHKYMMEMSALGVLFVLNTVSLADFTPEKIPSDWSALNTGYTKSLEMLHDYPKSAGVLLHVDEDQVVWVHDQNQTRSLMQFAYDFPEGKVYQTS